MQILITVKSWGLDVESREYVVKNDDTLNVFSCNQNNEMILMNMGASKNVIRKHIYRGIHIRPPCGAYTVNVGLKINKNY